MDENKSKRIIAFTSQSLKQYGIRAVRMDAIAQSMNVSKRTIYQAFEKKDNLINSCLDTYTARTKNMFQIIKLSNPNPLLYLWELTRAYIENLYKAKCVFWLDLANYYRHIFTVIDSLWIEELESAIATCRAQQYVILDLDIKTFLESFTTLLYNARVAECSAGMLYNSAYYMIRGIMIRNESDSFMYR